MHSPAQPARLLSGDHCIVTTTLVTRSFTSFLLVTSASVPAAGSYFFSLSSCSHVKCHRDAVSVGLEAAARRLCSQRYRSWLNSSGNDSNRACCCSLNSLHEMCKFGSRVKISATENWMSAVWRNNTSRVLLVYVSEHPGHGTRHGPSFYGIGQ